jgi:hypothetical protein
MRLVILTLLVPLALIAPVGASEPQKLLGRGAIKPSPVSKRAPLNYRAPHKKRHRAFGVW